MPLIPADILSLVGTPSLVADEALNDSDKTLTVPALVVARS